MCVCVYVVELLFILYNIIYYVDTLTDPFGRSGGEVGQK